MQTDEIKVTESNLESLQVHDKLAEVPEMASNEESMQKQINQFNSSHGPIK
ncbi:hypothetical protein [Aminipila luticellarii]|uniref:hypothetical protein n=1 Tax=Aminipila luticellarii TaxID=2507160 RepID=UPI0013E89C63|nr:hypothetical protein [Aminipila luticellarii]